jgi:hypothetical protein
VTGEPLDGRAGVVAVDAADHGLDSELSEPGELVDQLFGCRAAVVGGECERAGPLDLLVLPPSLVAEAAEEVELLRICGPGRRLQASA